MKLYYLLLVAVLLLLGACDIKEPMLPSWDVDLSLPLINERFYTSDLVDSTEIIIDSLNVLNVISSGEDTTPEFDDIPYNPDAEVNNIIVNGEGETGFIPFIDNLGQVEIAYAEFAQGLMRSRFTNVHPEVQELKLILHNMYTANGEELTITYDGNNNWVSIPLEQAHFGVRDSGILLSEIPFTIIVTPALLDVAEAARFSFEANTPMELSYLQGRLTDFVLELDESTTDIDIEYPYGLEQAISLQQATLKLDISNQIGFSAEFSGKLRATNEAGDIRILEIVDQDGNNYHVNPALSPTSPGLTYLEFTNNVSYLLQIMPTHIEVVDGSFTISTDAGIGSAYSTDVVTINYRVNAPFNFILHEHEIVIKEEEKLSISEDNRQLIRDNALGAELRLQVLNTLPVGAWANAYFSDSPDVDITNPDTYDFIKHATIHSSEINPDWQILEFSLSKEQLDVFTQPDLYIRWSFSFEETGHPVTIYATTGDYIHIKGMMIANILVEEAE